MVFSGFCARVLLGTICRTAILPIKPAIGVFSSGSATDTLDRLLHALAEDLRARGKLDLSETFIAASCSSAKKGALLSARLAEEKAVKSWRSQTAMVFLSPVASPALRLMKASSSKRPSRSVSREPNQNE